jgi:DNA sulfur modification protein DndE
MQFSKLRISSEATSKLRYLKQHTGLTPNLLCRAAAMLSMEEGPIGTQGAPDEDGSEFNAYTLTGEYEVLFTALLRFVEEPTSDESLTNEELVDRFRGHIHRGVGTLSVKGRNPLEIARLARVG